MNAKLCHYRDHEYEEGRCVWCDNAEVEIDALYKFYYPSFIPAAEIRSQDGEHCNRTV